MGVSERGGRVGGCGGGWSRSAREGDCFFLKLKFWDMNLKTAPLTCLSDCICSPDVNSRGLRHIHRPPWTSERLPRRPFEPAPVHQAPGPRVDALPARVRGPQSSGPRFSSSGTLSRHTGSRGPALQIRRCGPWWEREGGGKTTIPRLVTPQGGRRILPTVFPSSGVVRSLTLQNFVETAQSIHK